MPKGGEVASSGFLSKGPQATIKCKKNIVWTLVQGIVKIWGLATGLLDALRNTGGFSAVQYH